MEHTHQEQPEQLEQLERPEQDEQDEQDQTTEELYEWELHKLYDEMLDECHPVVMVCGMAYAASDVLKNCDPIAYRCGFNDWTSSEEWEEHPTDNHKYIRTVSY